MHNYYEVDEAQNEFEEVSSYLGRGTLVEEMEIVPLMSPKKQVSIRTKFAVGTRKELIDFLHANVDMVVWSHEDIPSIAPNIMVHRLNIDPSFRLVKQKRRPIDSKRIL